MVQGEWYASLRSLPKIEWLAIVVPEGYGCLNTSVLFVDAKNKYLLAT